MLVNRRRTTPPPNLKLCAPALFVSTALNCLVKSWTMSGRFCASPRIAKPFMFINASPVATASTLTPGRPNCALGFLSRFAAYDAMSRSSRPALEFPNKAGVEHAHVVALIRGRRRLVRPGEAGVRTRQTTREDACRRIDRAPGRLIVVQVVVRPAAPDGVARVDPVIDAHVGRVAVLKAFCRALVVVGESAGRRGREERQIPRGDRVDPVGRNLVVRERHARRGRTGRRSAR